MSRYVIDLRPDCKVVQQICESNGQVCIGARSIQYLEELNSDYINEHFGELRQDAYDRGYKDGRNVTETQAHDDAYQRGLDDAWEAARKLFSSMADSDIEKAFPIEWNNGGYNALINLQPQEAIEKLKSYEEKQKADDEIKVGDEVYFKGDNTSDSGVVTWVGKDNVCIMWRDGSAGENPKDKLLKTGRHFDIASTLENMRHD